MTKRDLDVETMFRLFTEIGIVAQLSGNAFASVLPNAMTLPQFVVLNHLARLGGNRTPLQMARAIQVTKGAMTNTLGHLERTGYISIVPDEKDGRSKRVDITTSGQKARQAAIRALEPELRFLTEAFPPSSVGSVLPFLEQLRVLLDERRN